MESLLACIRRSLLYAAIAVVLCGIGAFALGKSQLIAPLIAGSIIGVACWVIISYRILKSAQLSVNEAKRSMQFGLGIRLMLILGTLIMAVHISEEVFWAAVLGLFLMSTIMMLNAIVYAYNSNANDK